MTTNRRNKYLRMRGSRYTGKGHKRKTKGAGHRGGRGLAGTGKRADAKKPSIWHNTKYFGKHGFVNKNNSKKKALNVSDLNTMIYKFMQGKYQDKINFSNDIYTVDLTKLGYSKLLGKGNVEFKVKVNVSKMTDIAKSKIISE